jgi:hypothetical protein
VGNDGHGGQDGRPPLKLRHRRFVDAYLGPARGNGVAAARAAGYQGDGGTLAVTASRLLANPRVRAAVGLAVERSIMSRDEVLQELTDQARADVGDFIQVVEHELDLGTEKKPKKITITRPEVDWQGMEDAGLLRLVKQIKFGAKGDVNVVLHDKGAALRTIARYWEKAPPSTGDGPLLVVVEYVDEAAAGGKAKTDGDEGDQGTGGGGDG